MTLTPAQTASLTAQETTEAYLFLLDVYFNGVIQYRFTSDAVDTVYATNTYEPFPFDIYLPTSREGQPSAMQLRMDNVSQRMIDEIRTSADAIRIDLFVVLGSDKSLMRQETNFSWRNLTYDALSISGSLTLEGFLNEPYPYKRLDGDFAGLH